MRLDASATPFLVFMFGWTIFYKRIIQWWMLFGVKISVFLHTYACNVKNVFCNHTWLWHHKLGWGGVTKNFVDHRLVINCPQVTQVHSAGVSSAYSNFKIFVMWMQLENWPGNGHRLKFFAFCSSNVSFLLKIHDFNS